MRKSRNAEASITVEAVFIIPVLMLLFLMLLWFSFALHDRAIVEGAFRECWRRAVNIWFTAHCRGVV